jgi:monoamine oxidase
MTVVDVPVPSGTRLSNSSGITVIVVGLGLGGLATAIECQRKGHTVVAFDKVPIHTNIRE